MLAQPLDVFVTPAQVVPVAIAILEVFRDHGRREKRAEARLKWLLQEWGISRFRAAIEAQLGTCLPSEGRSLVVTHGGDHVGVSDQCDGRRVVGLLVPVGRTNADQLRELAELAADYGSGEVRFTVQQNVLIPDVSPARVEELLREPLLRELSASPSPFVRGLVTCTGNDYCHFSLIDTKGAALALAKALDERYEVDEPVRMHVSGCPHAWGLHRLGEIGLQGDRVRIDGEVLDAAHVFVGGEVGPHARLAKPLADGVLLSDLPVLVAEQVQALRGADALRRRQVPVS
jgi:ferredoxin-nitrite reductase